jgi:sugar phosphate isomerase/epimerase
VLRAGLVSITFRQLPPDEVVAWAVQAGLDGIEWGGDIHVPHGDLAAGKRVGALTRDAGLAVAAYGSYYRCGPEQPELFAAVLTTAEALGADLIRVWAGRQGSDQATPDSRAAVAADLRRVVDLAAEAGVRITTEWHGGTLTDTAQAARELFAAVDRPGLRTYWQPRTRQAPEVNDSELAVALPRLGGVHVFQWDAASGAREALAGGAADWPGWLRRLAAATDGYALLEFVRDDDPQQMVRDAATLRAWLAEIP